MKTTQKINLIGFTSSFLILLIGFFLKSNSLKIIGIIIGISTGIYTQRANKKIESEKFDFLRSEKEEEKIRDLVPEIEQITEKLELSKKTINYLYLQEEEAIKEAIELLSNYVTLWVDTETADWNNPTKKRLSLLQISANPEDLIGESVYVLDLLDKPDLIDYFINKIMVNESIQKVFHNAVYDVKFLGEKERVKNIFCTYKLSQKITLEDLGSENRQLKTLASSLCGLEVEESQQGSDWAIRPLTSQQIKYAVMDIVFLSQIHQKLENIYNSLELDFNYQQKLRSEKKKNNQDKPEIKLLNIVEDSSLDFEEELEKLLIKRDNNNHKNFWVYYTIRENFNLDLERLKLIGKALGYKQKWAYYQAGIPISEDNISEINNQANHYKLPMIKNRSENDRNP